MLEIPILKDFTVIDLIRNIEHSEFYNWKKKWKLDFHHVSQKWTS